MYKKYENSVHAFFQNLCETHELWNLQFSVHGKDNCLNMCSNVCE